jgi:hypothetical protein
MEMIGKAGGRNGSDRKGQIPFFLRELIEDGSIENDIAIGSALCSLCGVESRQFTVSLAAFMRVQPGGRR